MPIGGIKIDCYVLNNSENTRILSETSIFDAFKCPRKGNSRLKIERTKLPPFLAAKNLQLLITQGIIERTKLIEFIDGTRVKTGYNAEVLLLLCSYLQARRGENGVNLLASQKKMALQAEILQEEFAAVGIIALVDEVTGLQFGRKHDALRILLEQYVAEGIQKWIKRFPDELFNALDKLYKNDKTTSRSRPKYYGPFINTYIYKPIENGFVKMDLDKKNILPDGKRKVRFHQWLEEVVKGSVLGTQRFLAESEAAGAG